MRKYASHSNTQCAKTHTKYTNTLKLKQYNLTITQKQINTKFAQKNLEYEELQLAYLQLEKKVCALKLQLASSET